VAAEIKKEIAHVLLIKIVASLAPKAAP